ncbi:MAG: GTPase [Cyanobacteria bacterium J06597_16]
MMRIKPWQIAVLAAPIVLIVVFLLLAAGAQIRAWGLNWIWAIVIFVLLGWRWLLARWTRPAIAQAEALVSEAAAEATAELASELDAADRSLEAARDRIKATITSEDSPTNPSATVEAALQQTLQLAQDDAPVWEDPQTFWQRCLSLVTAISQAYHPDVKRPLLNIYVPEAYGLIRGTVDDTDRMMQKLTPVLGQISIGQMVEGVEVYRKLEPSAKKVIKAFNWAQWVLNPAAAIARQSSAKYMGQANQQIVFNLSALLRETALRNLAQQSVALYGGGAKIALTELTAAVPAVSAAKTQTLKEILEQAEPTAPVQEKPVNILLVGRTGAGKSSVINTLFRTQKAAVDVLPSTDKIQSYRWHTLPSQQANSQQASSQQASSQPSNAQETTESLILWDTPGYEQVARADLREQVIDYATEADALLLVTPALDPALQVDADFLQEMRAEIGEVPIFGVVSQVDKLRPIREWSPPYHWRTGAWPKETSIREAVAYRAEKLGDYCEQMLPLVTQQGDRTAWGDDELAEALLAVIAPAKQLRLARFLRSRTARTTAAAQIIDRYALQMSTTEGLTKLLKSPILQMISTFTTGNPAVGALLTETLPVEDVPVVVGKLQMAYELFTLLSESAADRSRLQTVSAAGFDLLALWPVLVSNDATVSASVSQRAWALGHALSEYWTQAMPTSQLEERVAFYLNSPSQQQVAEPQTGLP